MYLCEDGESVRLKKCLSQSSSPSDLNISPTKLDHRLYKRTSCRTYLRPSRTVEKLEIIREIRGVVFVMDNLAHDCHRL